MEFKAIAYETGDDGVVTITLNRPDPLGTAEVQPDEVRRPEAGVR